MQLSTGDSGSDLQSEINITPLVDVVLVLLIIFMVVVPLLLKGYDVDIPRASAATPPAQTPDSQVILSIGSTRCCTGGAPPRPDPRFSGHPEHRVHELPHGGPAARRWRPRRLSREPERAGDPRSRPG